MTKTQSAKTPFQSAPLPWAWNHVPPGGIPARERCLSVGTPKEKEQAVALVAAYREQEEISRAHDIATLSDELHKLGRESQNYIGGIEGEMKRRTIRAADPAKFEAAQTRLTEMRQEALDLVAPVLRRLLVNYSESLAQAALEAEARLEVNGLQIRHGNEWAMHQDSVCRALWSCRIKVEKALFELQPINAIGATQYFLTDEEHTPFQWL